MKTGIKTMVIAGLALAAGSPGIARAADESLSAATKERIERFEKGPSTINVSKYPEKLQDYYQVFATKCSQCHKLSRPINSDYVLPEEWSRYIKRMMHKPGSGISAKDAKEIYDFLVYDSSVRKKAQEEQALGKLPAEERKAQEAKIAEVVNKYK